jgi:DNA-binding CsgD family transcriptional regulator
MLPLQTIRCNNRIKFCLIISLFVLFSCQKNTQKSSKKERDFLWHKTASLFQTLPLEKVDSTIYLIEKNIKGELETEFIYGMLINNSPNVSPEISKQYFLYVESKLKEEDYRMRGILLSNKAQRYLEMGKKDSAFEMAQKGISLLKKGNDSLFICQGYFRLSNMYLIQDFALSATEACIEGLKYIPYTVEAEKIVEAKKMLKHNLLVSYRKQKSYDKSAQLINELILISEQQKDSMNLTLLYCNLGIIYARTNRQDSALWAGKMATDIFNLYTKRDESENTALGFAFLWRECKEYDKAIEYGTKTLRISDSVQNKSYLTKALFGLGNMYLSKKDLAEAEKYYNRILADSTLSKPLTFQRDMEDSLLVLGLKKENQNELLHHFYAARKHSDSLTKREDKQILSDMNVRYETSERETKIKELAFEKKIWQTQAFITALLLFLGIGISGWWVHRNRQKHLLLEKEKEILEINKQLQEKELEENKLQLLRFNENTLAKNKLIAEMEVQVNELLEKAFCVPNEEIVKNKEILNAMKILTEGDWKMYLDYFEKAKPDLIAQVNAAFPSLTQGELRLFLLINLGFKRQQIADILGISWEGARKNQYRLKKKLNLSEESNLEAFVMGF